MPEPLGKYSFIDAAIMILKQEGRAMKTREIVGKALKIGLIKTYGKTPDNTLTATLNRIVKEGGDYKGHKIIKIGKGTFSIKT